MTYHDKIQLLGEKFQQTKDNKYFEALYNLSYSYYKGVAYRYYLTNKHNIDDILSSFYVKVYENIDNYDIKKGRFTHWIGRIFTNEVYINYKLNNRLIYFENIFAFGKHEKHEEQLFDFLKEENIKIKKQKIKKLNNTLNELSEPFKTLLKEKYHNNMKLTEISKKYDLSLQNVKNGLRRGRLMLKEIMEDSSVIHNWRMGPIQLAFMKYNIKQERKQKLMDLSKANLIKIIFELEEQIKVFIDNNERYRKREININ